MARLIGLLIVMLVLTHLIFGPPEYSQTGLATTYSHRSAAEQIDRALDSVEEALRAVEEIQAAEDLEEAQELAADAEDDLKDAIDELEDIQEREAHNWLWLAEQGALYWHGPILDKETEQPVEAEVFVNSYLVADQATEVQFLMWATKDNPICVRVEAQGYQPWELRFRFHLQGLKVMGGPVWLVPEGGGTEAEGG
ncbi:MAG: hypothetical protein ACE5KR_01600 [Candidatus Bipolaricaulia bacterium]